MAATFNPATGEFADRVAWVVGAAGALGAAIARQLVARGAVVALSGRNGNSLRELERELGPAASTRVVDITDSAAVNATASALVRDLGRIDFLVNSATLPIFGDPLALSDEAWQQVMDTKWLGYVRTCRAVIPPMIAQGAGAIVNLSGRGGRQPSAVHLPGGSANAAVNLLTKGFADRFGPQGVRVNAVAPGPIRSPRLEALQTASGAAATTPAGEPDDVAHAVTYLLSDAARFVNGTVLAVDGGSLAAV